MTTNINSKYETSLLGFISQPNGKAQVCLAIKSRLVKHEYIRFDISTNKNGVLACSDIKVSHDIPDGFGFKHQDYHAIGNGSSTAFKEKKAKGYTSQVLSTDSESLQFKDIGLNEESLNFD